MADMYTSGRRFEQGLGLNDLDAFADLEWQREADARSAGSQVAGRKPVNLSSQIEDYLSRY